MGWVPWKDRRFFWSGLQLEKFWYAPILEIEGNRFVWEVIGLFKLGRNTSYECLYKRFGNWNGSESYWKTIQRKKAAFWWPEAGIVCRYSGNVLKKPSQLTDLCSGDMFFPRKIEWSSFADEWVPVEYINKVKGNFFFLGPPWFFFFFFLGGPNGSSCPDHFLRTKITTFGSRSGYKSEAISSNKRGGSQ